MTLPELHTLLTSADNCTIRGLRGAGPEWLAAALAAQGPLLCVVPDEHQIEAFSQNLDLFTDKRIALYPGQEIPPYTPLSADQRITAQRLASLYLMREEHADIMVCSIEALLRRTMPIQVLTSNSEYLIAGEDCERDALVDNLTALGYEQVALVQSVGDFAVRGSVIDIYPPLFPDTGGRQIEGPIRLDFFGDTVESLRSFDPLTQRSRDELEEAILLPVADIILGSLSTSQKRAIVRKVQELGEEFSWKPEEVNRMAERISTGRGFAGMEFFLPLFSPESTEPSSTVFDFLPETTSVLLVDNRGIQQSMNIVLERIDQNLQTARSNGFPALEAEHIFLDEQEFAKHSSRFRNISLDDLVSPDDAVHTIPSNNHRLLQQEISLRRSKHGLLAPLAEQLLTWLNKQEQPIICCRSQRHTQNLAELLTRHHIEVEEVTAPLTLPLPASEVPIVYLCNHPLTSGFSLPEISTHILSESELFGEMRLGKKAGKRPAGEAVNFSELNQGDIIVHRDHGLGIYRGMQTIEVQSVINDFLLIEYRDGDKLYLPVDRLNLVTRYQGFSDQQPRIDKLGSQNWKTTTSKIKEEVWKVAQELLTIYAQREIRTGRKFSTPGQLFHEMEESFPYDLTSGQEQSINQVIDDLTSDKPMDRLVCGDVGYGKTEVAVRAAFKVIEDGAQVAILVPTTVLAEQHAKTFTERLKGFPVSIGCLNRFRSPAHQRSLLKELKEGRLDIIIGTHRLLSKDVHFHDLGLLIIDEEHRFGVAHKEKLKKMRAEVDIMTLTATPIPRTLQMSLLNIRDLSVISTPPAHRQPVKTFVARFDELVIKEAVTRELRRDGQVFIVHNRVKSLHRIAELVQKLVPEARIAVAHGQMVGKELEQIMVSFVSHEVDVLVSTTIVESGLDIPSANTIIINRADMLGLAEIYQLRGRVGRSTTQAYAYLLVPSLDSLSKDSRDRLRALMDSSELGGGFKLAMNDLQIRGGGNLLGISQSGNIAAIGYELYLDLLQKTVADLKARLDRNGSIEDDSTTCDPEINLQISAYIPEEYIPDISQRYILYRRVASMAGETEEIRSELLEEFTDRYGVPPEPVKTLFRIIGLKKPLSFLGITKLEQGPDKLVFTFSETTPLTPEMLMEFLGRHTGTKNQPKAQFTPDNRLLISASLPTADSVFTTITSAIKLLNEYIDSSS